MESSTIKRDIEDYGRSTGRELQEACNYLVSMIPITTVRELSNYNHLEHAWIALQVSRGVSFLTALQMLRQHVGD